jgi:hypothetical protein
MLLRARFGPAWTPFSGVSVGSVEALICFRASATYNSSNLWRVIAGTAVQRQRLPTGYPAQQQVCFQRVDEVGALYLRTIPWVAGKAWRSDHAGWNNAALIPAYQESGRKVTLLVLLICQQYKS